MGPVPWSRAWSRAASDFWATTEPARHFVTSSGPELADRMAEVVHDVDHRLDHPAHLCVLDVGCGDASLLARVRERCSTLNDRVRWIGVDVHPVSEPGIESVVGVAPCTLPVGPVEGVVMAHEWLDEIPCDVVERDGDGVDRLVLVDIDGSETLGPELADDAACAHYGVDADSTRRWLAHWWPLHEPGDRAEVGVTRDRAWQWLTELVTAGTVVATDYGHLRDERTARHRHGTMAAYRAGRLVRPAPDGLAGITAHVALDACAASVPGTTMTRQRDEIPRSVLGEMPTARDVERHFSTVLLRDRSRLGDLGWLRWDTHRSRCASASTLPMW